MLSTEVDVPSSMMSNDMKAPRFWIIAQPAARAQCPSIVIPHQQNQMLPLIRILLIHTYLINLQHDGTVITTKVPKCSIQALSHTQLMDADTHCVILDSFIKFNSERHKTSAARPEHLFQRTSNRSCCSLLQPWTQRQCNTVVHPELMIAYREKLGHSDLFAARPR